MSKPRTRIVYPEKRGFTWLERDPVGRRARKFSSKDEAMDAARSALANQGGGLLSVLDRDGRPAAEEWVPAARPNRRQGT
jgi:hypothetical protein